jgi:hypothetical protein
MLSSRAEALPQEKNSISSWFRSIVDVLILTKTIKPELTGNKQSADNQKPASDAHSPSRPRADNLSSGKASLLPSNAPSQPRGASSLPSDAQTWHAWLKGGMRALANPSLFAKEAFFHSYAAKENVNYFELPLPWMPGRALELWVEDEGGGNKGGRDEESRRILLALNFSVIGETRVGIESSGNRLNLKIWAERPEPVEGELPQLQEELSALGYDAAISLNALTKGADGAIESIKSAISGPSLHALG